VQPGWPAVDALTYKPAGGKHYAPVPAIDPVHKKHLIKAEPAQAKRGEHVKFRFYGVDPWYGAPTVRLVKAGDKPDWAQPWLPAGLTLSLEVKPSYRDKPVAYGEQTTDKREFSWHGLLRTATRTGGVFALEAGTYAFHIRVPGDPEVLVSDPFLLKD